MTNQRYLPEFSGPIPRAPRREDVCEMHGPYEAMQLTMFLKSHGELWSRCPGCVREEIAAERGELAAAKDKEKLSLWNVTLSDARLPPRMQACDFGSYFATGDGQKQNLKDCMRYAKNFPEAKKEGRCLVFLGKTGTGKTHLACSIALFVMRNGHSVSYRRVSDVVRDIKSSWAKDAEESERKVVARLTDRDLLILDEVGIQFGTDFERDLIFGIIDTRYMNKLPTILISNLTHDETITFLGDRVQDRLRQNGGRIMVFDWASFRGTPLDSVNHTS